MVGGKLPDPAMFMRDLGRAPPAKTKKTRKAKNDQTVVELVKTPAFGAYNEPITWFGDPAFPSYAQLILAAPRRTEDTLIAEGSLAGIGTYVYSTGLVVVLSPDRRNARDLINLCFAVLARSGIPALALPDSELIGISDFDAESGAVRSSTSIVTPRNRLAGIPAEQRVTDYSFAVPAPVAEGVLTVADQCASNEGLRELSLRHFDAVTLAIRENYSEAFVVGWSLIESYLQSGFSKIWIDAGLAKGRIREMTRDWTSSQKIDLLLSNGAITKGDSDVLHGLRRTRNNIVHDLRQATKEETEGCLEKAEALTGLPRLEGIEPKRVWL